MIGEHRARLATGLLAMLLLCASCVAAPPPVASASPVPQRTLAGEPMRECRVGPAIGRCGSLSVAVDPTHPEGRRIDLRVAVVPATSSPRPDALFLVTGGPGGVSTISFSWALEAFRGARTTHDFVMVDQRGTGGSDELRLPLRPDVTGLTGEQRAAAIEGWLRPAFAALPDDVRWYTTRAAADDLDAVRAALGFASVDIYGASYGATVAQYYARQHPDRLDRMVLDGGTLLDVPVLERIATNVQRALDLMFERCESEPACSRAYPDLRDEFATVMRRLSDDPVVTDVVGPDGRPTQMDALAFAAAIHQGLLNDGRVAELPYRIHLAYEGRWSELARAAVAEAAGVATIADLVMSFVIRCSEPWARFEPEEIARSSQSSFARDTFLARALDQREACRWVPRGVTDPRDGEALVSNAPTLLLVGDADPQDPIDNVAGAATQLPSSTTVLVPGHGHTVAQYGCVGGLVSAFLSGDARASVDASCLASGGAPLAPFRLP